MRSVQMTEQLRISWLEKFSCRRTARLMSKAWNRSFLTTGMNKRIFRPSWMRQEQLRILMLANMASDILTNPHC